MKPTCRSWSTQHPLDVGLGDSPPGAHDHRQQRTTTSMSCQPSCRPRGLREQRTPARTRQASARNSGIASPRSAHRGRRRAPTCGTERREFEGDADDDEREAEQQSDLVGRARHGLGDSAELQRAVTRTPWTCRTTARPMRSSPHEILDGRSAETPESRLTPQARTATAQQLDPSKGHELLAEMSTMIRAARTAQDERFALEQSSRLQVAERIQERYDGATRPRA